MQFCDTHLSVEQQKYSVLYITREQCCEWLHFDHFKIHTNYIHLEVQNQAILFFLSLDITGYAILALQSNIPSMSSSSLSVSSDLSLTSMVSSPLDKDDVFFLSFFLLLPFFFVISCLRRSTLDKHVLKIIMQHYI